MLLRVALPDEGLYSSFQSVLLRKFACCVAALVGIRCSLEVCECDDEVHLRVNFRKGRDADQLHLMLAAWGKVAAKLKAGEITQEEYDRWRYRYPEFDTSGQWHKITPSQELSDLLLADLKEYTEK